MSIATEIERLQTAKANIKTAIEEKGVMVGDGTIDTYAEKIGEISSGGDNHYDAFWDAFQDYGNRRSYRNAFQDYGLSWKNGSTYNPKYPITVSSNAYGPNSVFANATEITDTLVDFICEGSLILTQTFNNAKKLKTIKKIVVNEGVTYSLTFQNCTSLENITFEGVIANPLSFVNSSLLTTESIDNIIACLKDLTGGTAQELTLHSTVGASLTTEQLTQIMNKNWSVV